MRKRDISMMILQFEVLKKVLSVILQEKQISHFNYAQSICDKHFKDSKGEYFLQTIATIYMSFINLLPILYIMSEDSDCQEREFSTFKSKHKIELCRSFNEIGFCQYGNMCIFAHGIEELQMHQPAIKIKKCRNYHANGYCRFGQRCNFRHEKNTRAKKKKNHYKFHKIFNGYGELILGVKMNCKLQAGESSSSSKNSQCSDAFYLD